MLPPLPFQMVVEMEEALPNCLVDDFVEMVKAVAGDGGVGECLRVKTVGLQSKDEGWW